MGHQPGNLRSRNHLLQPNSRYQTRVITEPNSVSPVPSPVETRLQIAGCFGTRKPLGSPWKTSSHYVFLNFVWLAFLARELASPSRVCIDIFFFFGGEEGLYARL